MRQQDTVAPSYRPDVDGLRAIAILAVVFYHMDFGFRGGFLGVDVFFVISGFLITGLILKNLSAGTFHIVSFWERRIRRILPALLCMVLACLVAGWYLLFPADFRELGQSVTAQVILVSNIFFYRNSDYFARAAEMKPLLHTWSLAVEEQFYVLLPFCLLACRRIPSRVLAGILASVGIISFGVGVYCATRYPAANFYLLPMRAWELLIGAVLAAHPVRHARASWKTEVASWGGLLAILGALLVQTRTGCYPWGGPLAACVGAAAVIHANTGSLTSAGRFLALRPVVFVGLISYSLYLWHWPLLVFTRYWTVGPLSLGARLVLLLAGLVLATLSWWWVERPFRARIVFPARPAIFAFAAGAGILLLSSGLAIDRANGFPARASGAAQCYEAGRRDLAFVNELRLKHVRAGKFVKLGTGDPQAPVALFVWGDSHAMSVMSIIDELCREHAIRGAAATHSATTPLLGYADTSPHGLRGDAALFKETVFEFIRREKVPHVILAVRWDYYVDLDGGPEPLREALVATVRALQGVGARVSILKQVPAQSMDIPHALAVATVFRRNIEDLGCTIAEHRAAAQRQAPLFQRIEAECPGVEILDPAPLLFTPSGRCRVARDGRALYYDRDHLTVAGAKLLRPLFLPLVERLGRPPAPPPVAPSEKL